MADALKQAVPDESGLDSDGEDQQEETTKAPESGPAPRTRTIRRRASRACTRCHERKVRCDVIGQGQPCTNCRLDVHQCLLRRRGDREPRIRFSKLDPMSTAIKLAAPRVKNYDEPIMLSANKSPATKTSANQISANKTYAKNDKKRCAFISFQIPDPPAANELSSSTQSNSSASKLEVIFSYYSSFLDSESLANISSEDFKFLELKGCLHLPVRSILDNFIYAYFQYVHPCLPILNERDFWQIYLDDGQRSQNYKPIPLFILRAMIFASCSFVSAETIHAMGFESFREARTCLYHRAKLLFDFDTASSSITISQGALILSYFCSEYKRHANTSWLQIAIQFAVAANAHLYYQSLTYSDEDRQTHKRLWWCCILRDRILPLGVRRSIQITNENFDFSQSILSEEDLAPEFDHSRVYDSDVKRYLARVLQAQLELAVVLTNVILLVYPTKTILMFNQAEDSDLKGMPARIQHCRNQLDQWNNRVKDSWLSYGPWKDKNKSVILYNNLTQIYYHSARTALYHQEAYMLQASPTKVQEATVQRLKEIGTQLYSTIASISENIGELVQLDMTRYLPVSTVPYIALPLILSSIDVQASSSVGFVSNSKVRQLRIYNEAFDLCYSRYTGITQASVFISKIIETAQLLPSRSSLKNTAHSDIVSIFTPPTSIGTNWLDAFISQPKLYLRIALTIDMSLSLGRSVEAEELPRQLQTRDEVAVHRSIMPMPRPVIDFLHDSSQIALIQPEKARLDQKQHVDSDYFELYDDGGSSDWDDAIWNGDSVDEILEDILNGREYSGS